MKKYHSPISKVEQGIIKKDLNAKFHKQAIKKEHSGGDEYYTLRELADICVENYKDIFNKYDCVYLPFSKRDDEIVKALCNLPEKKFKLLLTNDKFYSSEIGCNDFFLQINHKQFGKFINQHKVLIFDNPPFSKWAKIISAIDSFKLDYILFGDCLSGLNKLKRSVSGYHILDKALFKYTNEPGIYRTVCVGLFSNLFNEIKCIFYDTGIPYLHNRKLEWNNKVNPSILEDLCKNSVIPSSKLVNYARRGIVFNSQHIRKLWQEKGTTETKKVFGSACHYDWDVLLQENYKLLSKDVIL